MKIKKCRHCFYDLCEETCGSMILSDYLIEENLSSNSSLQQSFVVRKKNKKQKTLEMNFILDGNEIKNLRSSPINMI